MNKVAELSLEQMIQEQIVDRGIADARLLAAFRQVPREQFFPPGSHDAAFADRPSPIGHNQTISQPYIVALMTLHLEIHSEHRVLEIGTGSGYHTALLAQLAAEVWTVERIKPLLDAAWHRLMSLNTRKVHFRYGDGTLGWPEAAPFDRILLGAGVPRIPELLLRNQLVDGGIAVMPVGDEEQQMLYAVHRKGEDFQPVELCPCRFVKMFGREGWQEE